MRVDPYERAWMILTGLILAVLLAALGVSVYGMGIQLPGDVGQVDPQAVAASAPFDRPGLREVGPKEYEAVLRASAWQFLPGEIRVPAGSRVTFVLTSTDVIHGFRIKGTTVNTMVVPGEISRVSYTFTEPGEYPFYCHEYCGIGHHTMAGRVTVE